MSTVNALVAAARDGDVGQIKTLAKQCDVNTKDELGWCAVHRAAVHGQVASLRCLVANGADLDAVDDDGWRAIHRAAWVGDCPSLKVLIELGAGVEAACDATGPARREATSRRETLTRRGVRRPKRRGGGGEAEGRSDVRSARARARARAHE